MSRSEVTLIDGRVVDTCSEEWRAECEARSVCRMRTKADRLAYLERVRKKRSTAAMIALEGLIRDVWRAEFAGR